MIKYAMYSCGAVAVAALAVALPARAQTYDVPAGQTETITTSVSKGPVVVTGGGTLVFTKQNSYDGGTSVVDGSTLDVSGNGQLGLGKITLGDAASPGTLDFAASEAAIASGRDFVIEPGGGVVASNSNTLTLSAVISGGGMLTIGGGTVIVSGTSNTYSGGTGVAGGGTLEVSADTNLGVAGAGITLGNATSAGTIDFTNTTAVTSTRGIAIEAGGGTIDMGTSSATSWTFSGPLSGSGPLTVDGDGILIFDAASPYTGTATITSGTLEIGDSTTPSASIAGGVTVTGGKLEGYGTIQGTVTNDGGIVMPGGGKTPGNLTVGNYTQASGGTLEITVSPLGVSQLAVNGTADLDGTLKLKFDGAFHSTTLQLIGAGSVNGTFANEIGTLSVAVNQQIVYTPTGVDIELTQLSHLPENPTLYTALTSEAIDETQAASSVVLSRITAILNGAALDGMRTAELPDHAAGFSEGKTPYGAWASGLGGFGSTSGGGGAPGYSVGSGGFMTGIDTEMNAPGVFAGAAVGGSYASVGESGGASGRMFSPRAMLYGGWWHDWFAISGTLGLGEAATSSQRPIAGADTTSSASFSAYEYAASLQASTNLHLGPFVVTPSMGFQYALLSSPDITESGGPYDVIVKGANTNSLRPFVAATATTRFALGNGNTTIEPQLNVAFQPEVLSSSRQSVVQPVGDAQDFLIQGVDPSRNMFSASAGVTVETSHSFGVYSNVGMIYSANTKAANMDAGVRYRF